MLITFPHSLKESEEDKINRIKFTKFNKKRECGMCMLQNSYYSGHFFSKYKIVPTCDVTKVKVESFFSVPPLVLGYDSPGGFLEMSVLRIHDVYTSHSSDNPYYSSNDFQPKSPA